VKPAGKKVGSEQKQTKPTDGMLAPMPCCLAGKGDLGCLKDHDAKRLDGLTAMNMQSSIFWYSPRDQD